MSFVIFLKNKKKIKYLLQDKFNDDKAAGAIDGTYATDGKNLRTVSDSSNDIRIIGGKLVFDDVTSAGSSISYPSYARQAGKICSAAYTTISAGNCTTAFSFGTGAIRVYNNAVAIRMDTGERAVNIILASNTEYELVIVSRASGSFFFLRGGVYPCWILIGIAYSFVDVLQPKFSCLYSGSAKSWNHGFICVPDKLWLPTPDSSTGFAGIDGTLLNTLLTDGLGHAEGVAGGLGSGGAGKQILCADTWTISSNKAINTPIPLNNVVVNSDFGTDTVWGKGVGVTIGSGRAISDGTVSQYYAVVLQNSIMDVNKWYASSVDVIATAGGIYVSQFTAYTETLSSGTLRWSGRPTNAQLIVKSVSSTGFNGELDNFVSKELSISELIAPIQQATPYINHSGDLALAHGFNAGLSNNLDNKDNPQNYVLTYVDSGLYKLYLDKVIGGVYTNLLNVSITYVSGAKLVVKSDPIYTDGAITGIKYTVYYNDVHIGTTTLTGADFNAVKNNTLHGIFSTGTGGTVDNYCSYPIGAENQYSVLDKHTKE